MSGMEVAVLLSLASAAGLVAGYVLARRRTPHPDHEPIQQVVRGALHPGDLVALAHDDGSRAIGMRAESSGWRVWRDSTGAETFWSRIPEGWQITAVLYRRGGRGDIPFHLDEED